MVSGLKIKTSLCNGILILEYEHPKTWVIHLLNNKILPLPSPSTIGKLISSSNCHFGFHELALENIGKALQQFEPGNPSRYWCHMWDEIHLVKSIKFDTRRRVWDAVNYGLDFPEIPDDTVADHALLLIFRPYKLPWIQPIASFATKGVASGEVIHGITIKAITSLYTRGAIVKNAICYGHA